MTFRAVFLILLAAENEVGLIRVGVFSICPNHDNGWGVSSMSEK